MADRSKVYKSERLPSLPDVAIRLIEVSADPTTSIRDITSVVRADPGMTTRIIKAVNSPYFGLGTEVSSIESAVPLLGTSTVVSLALSFSLVQENHTNQHKSIWSQSLLTAVTAEYLARQEGSSSPGNFFLAGLISDIGILAMLGAFGDEYESILDNARQTSSILCELESEVLGFTHVDIGVDLSTIWSLPDSVIKAIRYHHENVDTIDLLRDEPDYDLIKTNRFAASVCDYLTFEQKDDVRAQLQEIGRHYFGFDDQKLDELLFEVRRRTDEAATLMSIDTRDLPHPTELLVAANARLADIISRDQMAMSQLATNHAQLKEQAVRDSLTGVHNRLAFDDRYSTTVRRCIASGGDVGVFFCDIDHFKTLNDTYGHAFGDKVLRRVAKTLEASVRDTDFVARYGGEEFVILALQIDKETFEMIGERLRANVESIVAKFEGACVPVTVSIGGCFATCKAARELVRHVDEELLTRADEAMYRCKRNGRNCTEICLLDSASSDRGLAPPNSLSTSELTPDSSLSGERC